MSSQFAAAIQQHGGVLGWIAAAACVVSTVLAGLRWLRVSQREHYLADSASRFALRWWVGRPVNRVCLLLALGGLLLSARWAAAAFATAAAIAVGPLGLGVRGRTAPLRWTRRLRTLAAVWALLQIAVVLVGVFSGFASAFCAAGAVVVPALVDLSCTVTAPLENRLGSRYVRQASERLKRVGPAVVAITGSYGKTSTKGYVAHLLSGSKRVASSPASFNNKLGLARAVNERLTDATEVFVAEMGTYGRGEIAALCAWMRPDIAVITAIGPVHLERFGTEEEIVRAKSEILSDARCCVLMVDDERLEALARSAEANGKKVWRVSSSGARTDVDVRVVDTAGYAELWLNGTRESSSFSLAPSARSENVACAVAVALEIGVPMSEIAKRLPSLPGAAHRLEAHSSPAGFAVLDDTYNSNPAGSRFALAALADAACAGRRKVVVTPGMVELGARQRKENFLFAEAAGLVATDMVVVGRTNRRALVAGFTGSSASAEASLVVVGVREQAVEWVRAQLGPGDAVLYENDLPDHYP